MTLSKQLLILILALFFMIFSVNFIISVNNMRSYLQVESQVHAQDTATSLGLSISPYIKDQKDPVIKTMMNAIFDRGYYKEITLVNAEEKPLVKLVNVQRFDEVPEWFIKAFPIQTASAESEISSGWNLSGILYVTINPGYAYQKLYEQAKSSLWYSTWAYLLAALLLLLVLRFILQPLKKINALALSIAHGQFDTIEKLPWTTEVRNVANSMNTMSSKIAKMIKSLNIKLDLLGHKLQIDELTGLLKRSSFDSELNQLYSEEDGAYIFLIKLDSLSNLVKEKSSEAVDNFLQEVARTLQLTSETFPAGQTSSFHFIGAEFALLIKDVNAYQVEQCAKLVKTALAELGLRHQLPDIAHIGVVPFNALKTPAELMAALHEAYEQAKLINANAYFIRSEEDDAKDIDEWKQLVFDAVDNHTYQVNYIGIIDNLETGNNVLQEAFIDVADALGNPVSIGPFVSIAEKFEKILDLDRAVTEQVINYIQTQPIERTVAVNISARTVKHVEFRTWLTQQLKANDKIAASLVFGMSAYAVTKDFKAYLEFVDFVHGLGAKVMLKRFDAQSMSLELAKQLRPDYIRISRELSNNLNDESGKASFVETLKAVSDLLDIKVLAENVQADIDFAILKAIGITGASR
jgi:EAL domain-containing protein (putative c-di-GMP-specific phosphodiesterase class I)/GGDEF domain-containing protein